MEECKELIETYTDYFIAVKCWKMKHHKSLALRAKILIKANFTAMAELEKLRWA